MFMTVLTLFVLVMDDCRLILTHRPADFVFGIIGIVCIVLFSFEIVLSSIGKDLSNGSGECRHLLNLVGRAPDRMR